MGATQIATFLVFALVVTLLVRPLGGYMTRVYQGEPVVLRRIFGPIERGFYRLLSVDPEVQQGWRSYATSVLAFSGVSFLFLYLILWGQSILPLNPEDYGAMPWDVNFNTAASFVSNTNWQFYGGETSLSYFSQMAGLAVQNFVSAAVGLGVALALIRGLVARSGSGVGNFWADLTRGILYILLPISFLVALFFVSQGVLQSLDGYFSFTTVSGAEQTLALGPVASQEAIKMLGTNGGGFFNVNSAMPFENATALTNFLQVLLIVMIPAALTGTFGRMVGNRRQGWALYGSMIVMATAGLATVAAGEQHGTPAQHAAGVATQASNGSTGGNMEGKEQRNGIAASALFANATTDASNGAVDSAHDAYSGTAGTALMVNMMTGEVIFGGVGTGLATLLMYALLAVFIAGQMVGRTPEYLGKKVGAREVRLVAIATIFVPIVVLLLTALGVGLAGGRESIFNSGPQGFSEALYAYTSQANNNGSAFAGFTGFIQPTPGSAGSSGVPFATLLGGIAMLIGRFVPLLAMLAVAGAFAGKRVVPAGAGTLRTDTATFSVLVILVIVLLAALTFFPALLLGPVVQSLTPELF